MKNNKKSCWKILGLLVACLGGSIPILYTLFASLTSGNLTVYPVGTVGAFVFLGVVFYTIGEFNELVQARRVTHND